MLNVTHKNIQGLHTLKMLQANSQEHSLKESWKIIVDGISWNFIKYHSTVTMYFLILTINYIYVSFVLNLISFYYTWDFTNSKKHTWSSDNLNYIHVYTYTQHKHTYIKIVCNYLSQKTCISSDSQPQCRNKML